tara:strand:- start:67 stop:738 length:672 start_codon:yes stop_codon:yes gene_type:complete
MKRLKHSNIHGSTGAGYIEKNIKGLYQCPECNKEYKTRNGLGQHINYKHLEGRKISVTPWNKGKKTGKRTPTKPLSIYPYTRIYSNTCKETGIQWWDKSYKKYHTTAKIKIETYRARANFKFNVYDYKEEFDLTLLEKYGWYSPGGKYGKNKNTNFSGISRDHMYSIKDGYDNNINPNILSHPANCKLVLHNKENLVKGRKSSITIEELLDKIKLWDLKYLVG